MIFDIIFLMTSGFILGFIVGLEIGDDK